MRSALTALSLALLGFATAFLVACGDRSGLLASTDAGELQDALARVQSACAAGDMSSAALDAQRFADRVSELSPRQVDARLLANLEQGARTLEALVPQSCAGTETTAPTTATVPTTSTTAPTTTETTTTTTAPTTPTTPTTTLPPPGGAEPGKGKEGKDNKGPGGVPPGQAKKGNGGAGDEGGE